MLQIGEVWYLLLFCVQRYALPDGSRFQARSLCRSDRHPLMQKKRSETKNMNHQLPAQLDDRPFGHLSTRIYDD